LLALAAVLMAGSNLQRAAGARDAAAPADPKALVGRWKVDLRPEPNAEPYYKDFIVKAVEGNTFSGTFYGTDFVGGHLNTDWGVVHFAFVTEDKSGPYNHSGSLRDGKLQGLTHSVGRKFLSVWTAEKAE
jgi:hypothetical protein